MSETFKPMVIRLQTCACAITYTECLLKIKNKTHLPVEVDQETATVRAFKACLRVRTRIRGLHERIICSLNVQPIFSNNLLHVSLVALLKRKCARQCD